MTMYNVKGCSTLKINPILQLPCQKTFRTFWHLSAHCFCFDGHSLTVLVPTAHQHYFQTQQAAVLMEKTQINSPFATFPAQISQTQLETG